MTQNGAEIGSWRASNAQGSASCCLGSRLRLMTGNTEALEIRVIITATLGDVDDVVDLKLLGDQPTAAAGVLITKQDALSDAAPWPTSSTRTPLRLLYLLDG